MQPNEIEMELAGYVKQYDYTQYANDNHVNVIPEEAFKRLVSDTFKTITDTLRGTYGPYGSTDLISEQAETMTTKDGYNVFNAMRFCHAYKHMVYLAIKKIIDRVNRNVGDGTTSCILLAEKIFNNLNKKIKTPDDKRQILSIITNIEQYLQNDEYIINDKKKKHIKPLTIDRFKNIITLASNYDMNLTDTLVEAFQPEVDEYGNVSYIRNVVAEEDVTLEAESSATYKIEHFPGDYRVRINIGVEPGIAMANKTKIKVVIYDHAFGSNDWIKFKKNYDDKTPVLILARTFARNFMEAEWMNYLKEKQMKKKMNMSDSETTITLAEVKGVFVQNEIKDLAAVINTDVRGVHALDVNFDLLPEVTLSVYNGNCLILYDVEKPTEYVEILKKELEKDTSNSYVKRKDYLSRIKALSMDAKDTLVVVKSGTSLESKMIMDKIDDCTSIIESAISSGVVPNMLVYGHMRMKEYVSESDSIFEKEVSNIIAESITELFDDVWVSKYTDQNEEDHYDAKEILYSPSTMSSYDIINNEFVSVDKLSTSAQYDLEVIVASLSIVKYLLTSRAFIFDAHLLTPVNDSGHYTQKY